MTRLEQSVEKYNTKGDPINFGLPFEEFIYECYNKYNPSSYGGYIQKKIEQELEENGMRISSISAAEDRGDFEIYVPHAIPYNEYLKLNFEIKTSFLGKTEGYTIRNIRPYQKLSGGYILCLIDCSNNFNIEFYLVDYKTLSSHLNMSHMNGTSSQHNEGGFQNYGTAFNKDSFYFDMIKKFSKINGNTLEDLITYFKGVQKKMFTDMMESEEVIEYKTNRLFQFEEFFLRDEFSDDEFNEGYENSFRHINSYNEYKEIVTSVMSLVGLKYDRLKGHSINGRAQLSMIFIISGEDGCFEYFKEFFKDFKKEFSEQVKVYYKL